MTIIDRLKNIVLELRRHTREQPIDLITLQLIASAESRILRAIDELKKANVKGV